MSYALRHGEHVRVDVLFGRFRPRTKHVVDAISAVLGMVFCVLVVWLSIPYIEQSWSVGEGSSNPGGLGARYIVKSLIPIGFGLLFLQSLSQAIHSWNAARSAS
jgi:TRAP-type mannitol/chloroaromatic compound transport system permease small subunit